MPLTSLEADWQTMHAVPKYGIQIQRKTDENCCSLKVKTFVSLLVYILQHKSGKNYGFSEVNTVFGWSSY